MRNSIFLIFMLTMVMVGCKNESHTPHTTPAYTVSRAQKKDTLINREYVAQIRAYQHIELRVLDEGYLKKVYVDEGQFVKKGQLLFQQMPVVYQAEMQKSKAEYAKAEIEFNNTKALADSNIVSKNELALSMANLEKTRAELALANANLQFTEIRAPFDGIVGRFNEVREGSLLEEGELLTTLSDNSKMWVYFNVPETVYLNYIKNFANQNKKQPVYLQLADGGMYEQTGVVETIESDFNNETGNIAFRATFQNPKTLLRHGQTGKILMPLIINDAIILAQQATYEVLNKKFVYVIKGTTIEAREIEIGNELPHLYIVSSGLTEKDTVLMDGLRRVKNGDHIRSHFVPQNEIISQLKAINAE